MLANENSFSDTSFLFNFDLGMILKLSFLFLRMK